MRRFLMLLFVAIVFSCCNNTKTEYEKWINKQIYFPDNIAIVNSGVKIVSYTGLADCVVCEIAPNGWRKFIKELDSIAKIPVFLILHPKKKMEDNLRNQCSDLPMYFDVNDDFFNKNNFPEDKRFRCFLLDENNHVILIGNPVHNPKIKDLYIRTICERLGVTSKMNTDQNPQINLGVLSKNKSKTVQFEIKNVDKDTLHIDSVYTSCECTTAKIDKIKILKNESAFLSITYMPDGIGDFYREVYVKVKGEERTRIFAIEGKVE